MTILTLACLLFPHCQVLVTSPWIVMVTILVNIRTLLLPPPESPVDGLPCTVKAVAALLHLESLHCFLQESCGVG